MDEEACRATLSCDLGEISICFVTLPEAVVAGSGPFLYHTNGRLPATQMHAQMDGTQTKPTSLFLAVRTPTKVLLRRRRDTSEPQVGSGLP